MSPPCLALLAEPGTSSRAVPLLTLLALDTHVVSWHRREDHRPTAVLATTVPVLSELRRHDAVPTAVWVDHHDQIDEAHDAGATMLLTIDAALESRGAVLVPPFGIEVDRWPATAPLVRRRWRERLGLDDEHILKVEGAVEGPDAERELSVCSVAVVSGPATLLALAMGTPVVTSRDTAKRLGLRPGRDVEVAAGPAAALALAREIATDDVRAAELSRRGRRCAEHHLDLGRPAHAVASGLGLTSSTAPGSARVDARLDELATPATSPIRTRVADALAVLTADGGGSSS